MIVKRAGSSDIRALMTLISEYWKFEKLTGFQPGILKTQVERLLSSADLGAIWVAEKNGQLVGYLILVYVFSLEHKGMTAEIDEFFVDPEYRGSGVGSRLLSDAEAEAVRFGCTNISLQIAITNQRASGFYTRHGYAGRTGFQLLDKDLG